MRLLRIIFIFIFIIAGLYLLASLFIPAKFVVQRTQTLNAPVDIVFEQISTFKNWEKWSAWKEKDPKLVSLYSRNSIKIGSYWLWKSKLAGKGRLTATNIKDQEQLNFHLRMEDPYELELTGNIRLEPNGSETKVIWRTEGANPFHLRVLNLFMDKKIGPDLDRGLELLKAIAEKESEILQKEYFGYRIKQLGFGGANIAYIRKAVLIDELDEFFIKNFSKVRQEAKECNFKTDGQPMALFYRWDFVNGVATVGAAIPVKGDSTLGHDVGLMQLQPQRALLLNYYGGYKSMKNAYSALDNFAKNKKLKITKPTIEEYTIGPKQQRDSSKWHTKIWYLLAD